MALIDVKLDDNAILFEDLQMDGLDIETFMEEFSIKFHVDISDFDLKKYGAPESDIANLPKTIFNIIFWRNKIMKKTFGLDHLLEVVKQKKWFDP